MDSKFDDQALSSASPPVDKDSRRLRVLWLILAGYYFVFVMALLKYAPHAPYQLVVIGAMLNFAIFAAIVTPIIRIYRRRRLALGSSPSSVEQDARRLRSLWVGLCVYVVITVNALRYIGQVPASTMIGAELMNIGILLAILQSIRRVSKRLGK